MSEVKNVCVDDDCCCDTAEVGTIIDNSDCVVNVERIVATQEEAQALLASLTAKARGIESEPCAITSNITAVDGGYSLVAAFDFSCQAETLIFQFGLR